MTVNYNEPITFGRGGNATKLNCAGISFTEDEGRSWTLAPVAELDVQLPFARRDVMLEVEASPFLVPDILTAQNVFVFLGGLFVGYYTLTGHTVRSFPINRGLVSGRTMRLTLVMPAATSPHALGLGEDLRQLGIYLTSITFKTAP